MRILTVVMIGSLFSLACFAGDMTGYISDTKCAAEHAKSPTAAGWIHPKVFESCAKMCVKDGSEAVFLTEDNKVVKIDTDSLDKVMPHLGHKVKLSGKVEDGRLKVDSINTLSW